MCLGDVQNGTEQCPLQHPDTTNSATHDIPNPTLPTFNEERMGQLRQPRAPAKPTVPTRIHGLPQRPLQGRIAHHG